MNAIVETINTLQTQLADPFTFRGSVPTVADLPSSGNAINDTYYVTEATCLYSWNGTSWEVASLSESEYLEMLQRAFGDIDALKNALFDENTVSSPYTAGAEALMQANIGSNGYVITGTKNKAALYPMKQGIFTANGLTVTVSNNTVTVVGTASSATYFSLKDGVEKTPAEIASETLDLPSGNWYFSCVVLDGYTAPISIQCRKKDNTTVTFSASVPQLCNPSTWGGLMIYVASGTTVNRGSTLCITKESEKGDVQKQISERVKWLKASALFEVSAGDYIISGSNTELQTLSVKENLGKKLCLKYSTRTVPNTFSQEVVDVYVPMKTGYVDYIFAHTVNGNVSTGGGNVWRLAQVVKVNDSFEQEYFITALGETEMALKIQGRDDFIGGTAHGDEWIDNGSMISVLDGSEIDISTISTLTEFTKFEVVTTSTLYDPNDHTTVVGYHGTQWTFTVDGLDLRQVVQFNGDYSMVGSYMPMVAAIRNSYSTQTIQITDAYIDDGNFKKYDISNAGFTTYPNMLKNDVNLVYMFGDSKDIQIIAEYLEQPEGLAGAGTYLYNGAAYNKLYNVICGYNDTIQPVSENTKWQTHAKIQIIANK